MKVQYTSDLHIEFRINEYFLNDNPIKPIGDILILAGDILPLKLIDEYNLFFDYLSENFKYTYWIPGNHEYYHFDINTFGNSFKKEIRKNVLLINNKSFIHENTKFVFSTLWTKIAQNNSLVIQNSMNDFRLIKNKGNLLNISDYNNLHEQDLDFIKQEVKNNKQNNIVVVTHHVPTIKNYPKQYKNSALNSAFAVDLTEYIENSNIDFWIYGHSHSNTKDFLINNTKMLTNQLGYVQNGENAGFDNTKIIDINYG